MERTKFTILCLWTILRNRSRTLWDAPWRGWGPRSWCRNRTHSLCRARQHSRGTIELTISHQLKMKTTSCEDRSLRWNAHSASPTKSSLMCHSRNSLLRANTTSTKLRHRENCSNCRFKWRKLSRSWTCFTHKCANEVCRCPLLIPPTGFHSTRDRSKEYNHRQTLSRSNASWKSYRES